MLPLHLATDTRFEVQVLSCCLLLNLVEHSADNRAQLVQTQAPDQHTHEEEDLDIFGGMLQFMLCIWSHVAVV